MKIERVREGETDLVQIPLDELSIIPFSLVVDMLVQPLVSVVNTLPQLGFSVMG